jgi:hypothetical protein
MAMIFAVAAIGSGIYFYTHPSEAQKKEAEQWAEYRGAKQTCSYKTLEPDLFDGVVTGNIAVGVFVGIIAVAVLGVSPLWPQFRRYSFLRYRWVS